MIARGIGISCGLFLAGSAAAGRKRPRAGDVGRYTAQHGSGQNDQGSAQHDGQGLSLLV